MAEHLPENFTVYCRYDRNNRIQQSNFARWNRSLSKDREAFEVIVFHDDPDIKKSMDKFRNLRFWRLHSDMSQSGTGLLNEAMRYARANVLVYVSADVLVRKSDLYRLANHARFDFTVAWLNLKYGFFHRFYKYDNTLVSLIHRMKWWFNIGRYELYARQNAPFDFYKASLLSFNKPRLNEMFAQLSVLEKQKLFQSDLPGTQYLNYELFHLLRKFKCDVINAGRSGSYDFNREIPGFYYSYQNTRALLRQIFRRKGLPREGFHYPLSPYRFILPVMQLTQLFFLVFVWFIPWLSLNFIAFYGILAASLIIGILEKKQLSPILVLLWFFSWFVA